MARTADTTVARANAARSSVRRQEEVAAFGIAAARVVADAKAYVEVRGYDVFERVLRDRETHRNRQHFSRRGDGLRGTFERQIAGRRAAHGQRERPVALRLVQDLQGVIVAYDFVPCDAVDVKQFAAVPDHVDADEIP